LQKKRKRELPVDGDKSALTYGRRRTESLRRADPYYQRGARREKEEGRV